MVSSLNHAPTLGFGENLAAYSRYTHHPLFFRRIPVSNHPRRNALLVALSSFVLSLLSLGWAARSSAIVPSSCPSGGIVACVPSPSQFFTIHFMSQPFSWVGVSLLVIALISGIVGIMAHPPSDTATKS